MMIFGIALIVASFVLVGIASYNIGLAHGRENGLADSLDSVKETFTDWKEAMEEAEIPVEKMVEINQILTKKTIGKLNTLRSNYGTNDASETKTEEIKH